MLEAAAQAEADGDGETAERILAQPLVVDIPVPQPVFMPPVATTMPPPAKVSGVSFRETWTAEVTDFRALVKAVAEGRAPLSLVQADESALGQYARSTRGTQKVPGVRFFPKTTTAVRAARCLLSNTPKSRNSKRLPPPSSSMISSRKV